MVDESAIETARLKPLLTLLELLESRYPDLAGHGELVGAYCVVTAEAMQMSHDHVDCMLLAGTLHDLGKLVLDDEVLLEPGPLNDDQWRQVMRHPELGADLLVASNLDEIARWVLAHHERVDGRGYPFGLCGDEIPLEAKILAVTDSYDAMRTHRVYRAAMSHEQAVEELRRNVGSQFDGFVVEAFLDALDSLDEPVERSAVEVGSPAAERGLDAA
jgi:HD-GYP domain-containing protein (c-di-GMP phosphodiesterase class II)